MLAVAAPGWAAFDRRRLLATVLLALGVAFPFGLVAAAIAGGRSWVALSVDEDDGAVVLVELAVSSSGTGRSGSNSGPPSPADVNTGCSSPRASST